MSDISKILEDLDKLINAKSKEAIDDLQKQIEQAIIETGENLTREENDDNEKENNDKK